MKCFGWIMLTLLFLALFMGITLAVVLVFKKKHCKRTTATGTGKTRKDTATSSPPNTKTTTDGADTTYTRKPVVVPTLPFPPPPQGQWTEWSEDEEEGGFFDYSSPVQTWVPGTSSFDWNTPTSTNMSTDPPKTLYNPYNEVLIGEWTPPPLTPEETITTTTTTTTTPAETQKTPQKPKSPAMSVSKPQAFFSPEQMFSVVCYNVRCDVDKPPHDWKSRKSHVLANILQYNPSVVCLQESTEKVKQYLCEKLPGSFVGLGSYRDASSRSEATHVLVDRQRWKVLQSRTFMFGQTNPRECQQACTGTTSFGGLKAKHPRIFTHAQLQGQVTLHVLNTHFPLNQNLQEACAAQLAEYVNQLPAGEPVLVMGDLNSHYPPTQQESPLRTLLEKAACADVTNLENLATFGPFGHLDKNVNKLDYVLFRDASNTLSLVNTGVSGHVYGPKKFRPSDHEALFATFAVN